MNVEPYAVIDNGHGRQGKPTDRLPFALDRLGSFCTLQPCRTTTEMTSHLTLRSER
jgi:hypothetical protein